jgi:hypothetical protein
MTSSAPGFATVERTDPERSHPMVQSMYEVRVAGTLPEEDLKDMGAVASAPDQVSTVLYGISDQSALYGLLARLRALGIEVIEVRRVSEPADASSEIAAEAAERSHDGTEG